MEKLDNTAERTALWRALHLEIDANPPIFKDDWALRLTRPGDDWQQRPDMKFTKPIRASIVGRARFVEDQILHSIKNGVTQYIILGAGLDSFALRHPDLKGHVEIYEIDQPDTLQWKERRIKEHLDILPGNLHFIPVDFERAAWWEVLKNSRFDFSKPTAISCTGVTLYLSKEAIDEMLLRIADLAAGSTAVVSFYAPVEDLKGEDKALMEVSIKGAASSGTPMISFFNATEVKEIAVKAGLKNCRTFDTDDLIRRYFEGRSDGLLPNAGEIFLVAEV